MPNATKPPPNAHPLRAYCALRRIAMALRCGKKGCLSRYRDYIDNYRVTGGPLGKAILARMLSSGALIADGHLYVWSDSASEILGVTWHQLQKGESSERLDEFLRLFILENQKLF